ncbi:MAG TPA: hypothetical protein VF412_19705 [Bdellovibrio sp.]|uniref:hypothetical protein n=1 Tax=Bdellovibrio sp. TaxID=28201 RepID=UPI002F03F14C
MLQSFKIITVMFAVTFGSIFAFAQSDQPEAPMVQSTTTTTISGGNTSSNTVRKERKAQLNFEDELVEGSTQKPELFYLFQKKNFNYKRLIKLRENFLPEMRRSAEDVQRVRGAN